MERRGKVDKFKKCVAGVIQVSMFTAFVIGTALAIADMFGGLESHPRLHELFPKITLLLVGLLGSSVILQY
jgi:hypothetical protein